MFLNGLNDDIQFQLLNTDYADFQHMVDKAIVIESKRRMARGRCHSLDSPLEVMLGLASRSLPSFSSHSRGTGHRCQYKCLALSCRGLNNNHLDPTGSNHLARACNKVLDLMPQPRTVHQLKETVLVEPVSSVV
jgi:hypothetical protein